MIPDHAAPGGNGRLQPQGETVTGCPDRWGAGHPEKMVRSRRLELPRDLSHSDLNAARLPVPPRPHIHLACPWVAGNSKSRASDQGSCRRRDLIFHSGVTPVAKGRCRRGGSRKAGLPEPAETGTVASTLAFAGWCWLVSRSGCRPKKGGVVGLAKGPRSSAG